MNSLKCSKLPDFTKNTLYLLTNTEITQSQVWKPCRTLNSSSSFYTFYCLCKDTQGKILKVCNKMAEIYLFLHYVNKFTLGT